MMNRSLFLSFTPANDRACLEGILGTGMVGTWPPDQIAGDSEPWLGPKKIDAVRAGVKNRFRFDWNRNDQNSFLTWIRLQRDPTQALIKARSWAAQADVRMVCEQLEKIPFEYCSGASASSEWGFAGARREYFGCQFGDGHVGLGWMCAFQGEGHRWLASRRWLEFGPWRLIRGKNDLSFVQFHDLRADDETALEQARPGHLRMGYSALGGFIAPQHSWELLCEPAARSIRGVYDETSKTLLQVVAGREIEPLEMFEAAAIKVLQPVSKPIEQVAYVFIDEGQARTYLHELWLRGLEVRAFIGGKERRLDEDYHPVPKAPEWVKRAQDRDGL